MPALHLRNDPPLPYVPAGPAPHHRTRKMEAQRLQELRERIKFSLFQENKKTNKQQNNKTKWFVLYHTNNIVLDFVFLLSFHTSGKQRGMFSTLVDGLKATKQKRNKTTNKTRWQERKFAVKQQINQVLFGIYLKFDYICAMIADQARPAHIDWNIHHHIKHS